MTNAANILEKLDINLETSTAGELKAARDALEDGEALKHLGLTDEDIPAIEAAYTAIENALANKPSKVDQIQSIYDRLSRIQDDLIELSEELYDLFNGEPDEDGPVAQRLNAAHEAVEDIWGGADDPFGDALFSLARAVRAAKKEA
jgi:archaellum component FlaC